MICEKWYIQLIVELIILSDLNDDFFVLVYRRPDSMNIVFQKSINVIYLI